VLQERRAVREAVCGHSDQSLVVGARRQRPEQLRVLTSGALGECSWVCRSNARDAPAAHVVVAVAERQRCGRHVVGTAVLLPSGRPRRVASRSLRSLRPATRPGVSEAAPHRESSSGRARRARTSAVEKAWPLPPLPPPPLPSEVAAPAVAASRGAVF
jgi:hypothetical protein